MRRACAPVTGLAMLVWSPLLFAPGAAAQACTGLGPLAQWTASITATKGMSEMTEWWAVAGTIRTIGPLAIRIGRGQYGYRVDDASGRYREFSLLIPYDLPGRLGVQVCGTYGQTSAAMSGARFTQKDLSLGIGASRFIRLGIVTLGGWAEIAKTRSDLRTSTLGKISYPPEALLRARFPQGRVGLSVTVPPLATIRLSYGGPIGYSRPSGLTRSEAFIASRFLAATVAIATRIPHPNGWRFP